MRVTVKLFSNLMEYLPAAAEGNSLVLQLTGSVSSADILDRYKIPRDAVQVVMVNGEFQPEERRSEQLSDGDTLSIWPAIQGG